MVFRIILTFLVMILSSLSSSLMQPIKAILSAHIATEQLNDSDASFVASQFGLANLNLPSSFAFLITVALLVAIWFKPAKKWVVSILAIFVFGCFVVLHPSNALAFAEKTDRTEFKSIEPDETAFIIPNFGDTVDSQKQYTPEYLNKVGVKVPGKFIQIPHQSFSGTGGSWSWSYYVNTATLVTVKRSQYARVWTKVGRGTGSADESFNCQTKDGLNIKHIGVSIIVSIKDADAALYLSNFGQEPIDLDALWKQAGGDATWYEVNKTFVSQRMARSLHTVADTRVYSDVHILICKFIAMEDTPEKAASHMNEIMDSVTKELTPYLSNLGITLHSIGWADSWDFDDDVQRAMNQKFIAAQVGPVLPTLERNAAVNLQEGLANGYSTKMPSVMLLGQSATPAVALPKQ